MNHTQLRTEQEMMLELALKAVKIDDCFVDDGSQYSMPDGEGKRKVYNTYYLDIKYIETGKQDCVVKLVDQESIEPAMYCLLSELQDDDE